MRGRRRATSSSISVTISIAARRRARSSIACSTSLCPASRSFISAGTTRTVWSSSSAICWSGRPGSPMAARRRCAATASSRRPQIAISSASRASCARRLPQSHLDFMRGLTLSHVEGDYYFTHAGVRPGVSLDEQDAHDLLWIRDEFLSSNADFGKIVVHGHTITDAARGEAQPHRHRHRRLRQRYPHLPHPAG